jgi:ribosomal protein S18 acetylase RimI-like enzyme
VIEPAVSGPRAASVQVIDGARDSKHIAAAAQVWAEATAARDGLAEVPGPEVSGPVIQRALGRSSRALLLIARSADGTVVGFAAAGPLGGDQVTAELNYLGVRPGYWGQGIGEALLSALAARLKAADFARAELSVYTQNGRAAALYERLGWRPRGQPVPHRRTGRPEQRYELRLKRPAG